MNTEAKPRHKYCHPHAMWKVKNANGDFICVKCKLYPSVGNTNE